MTHCRTSATCNYPEGECIGLCLHRINTETMTKRCAAIKGKVQELPIEFADEPSAFVAACDAYKTHRPRGRMKALIHAWKRLRQAWRTRHIPDPFKAQQ